MSLTLQQMIELEGALDDAVLAITGALAPYSIETRTRAAARYLKTIQSEIDVARPRGDATGDTPIASGAVASAPKLPQESAQKGDGDEELMVYEKLHRLLLANPGMSFDDMATHMYGEVDKNTKQSVRTQLNNLRKKGWAKTDGSGYWEAVSAAPRRRAHGGADK